MESLRNFVVAALFAISFAGYSLAEGNVVVGDDGLHKQPWFFDSFLEMGPDLEEAADSGKGLVVIFEQRGCPYCSKKGKDRCRFG